MTEPKRRGRPPKVMAQPTDRLAQLTAREKALAIKANARHRYTVDLPLELYEQLLDQAEAWGQPLPDVVRACLRSGLDSIRRFGGASGANPFVYGKLTPPSPADIDPSGMAWPPVNNPTVWSPQWDNAPPIAEAPTPPPMRIIPPPKGLLPNGYTPPTDSRSSAGGDSDGPNLAFSDDSETQA